jgi:hypothetical protein
MSGARKAIGSVTTIGLVACAKSKRKGALPARELYSSELFKKAIRYSRRNYDRWYILSAKHGLVEPETVLEPYDEALSRKSRLQQETWARSVFQQLLRVIPRSEDCALFFHAGIQYRKNLLETLSERGYRCEVPLEGLGIGEQLAWYKSR